MARGKSIEQRAKRAGAKGKRIGTAKQALRDTLIVTRKAQDWPIETIAAEAGIGVRAVHKVVEREAIGEALLDRDPIDVVKQIATHFKAASATSRPCGRPGGRGLMARSILSDAERLAWERFPQDPDPDVVGVYFTLADGEVDVLRRLPTPAGRLATAVAIAAIRWLGFVPAELEHVPNAGIQRLASELDIDVEDLATYDPPERTARDHRQRAAQLAPGCAKVRLPPPAGEHAMVFELDRDAGGRVVLMFLAFGLRHPPPGRRLNVYRRAHRRRFPQS